MLMLKLLLLDFKKSKFGSLMIIFLIALSTALSITVSLQERALREGSAQAADRFDLVVGAPGSEVQLVLSTVFLQPSPLNLLDTEVFKEIEANPQVDWAAPLAFGDYYQNMPIIGTNTALLLDGGERQLAAGRVFEKDYEAVVGAKSGLALGDSFSPMHGQLGESNHHAHDDVEYHVVGILPEEGSVWDKALLVPITSVWDVHQHHDHDHDHDHHAHEHDGPPGYVDEHDHDHDHDHAIEELGVSAVVIKPQSFAGAYQLRSQYKTETTQAVFPAEVLVRVYGVLGDSKEVLLWVSIVTQVLVATALLMIIVLYLQNRQKQVAAWRIFGAPRAKIFLLIWFALIVMIALAMLLGVAIGYVAAQLISQHLSLQSGFVLPVRLGEEECRFILFNFIFAILIALLPSLLLYRQSPINVLRNTQE
ncbi:putative ABC transport system permease protein [Pasteurella testudinis DSM 23072]|uniref:Putative ABC transport system permease protein n=1 Tax=Pasteurella testudinis DSM 23072 TaxID=1122938 RepID=A0A1W1V3Q4_9PAST|nr:FtsX-like permease family protein [Pasteurella testudinis]SMB87916.1 putative ABC transport system permease protein [Pasteurella testudinis DSM 23072]SUB52398.1 FtsX-like permease family [Pasteurella testudinis]